MHSPEPQLRRRELLAMAGGVAASLMTGAGSASATPAEIETRIIPANGEALPAIGMGSWLTFSVGDDPSARAQRREVLQAFFDAGGRLIDSSPMYGSSEEVIGDCLRKIGTPDKLFSATKVWTIFTADGPRQMEESRELWGVESFDLMQIHNLLNWQGHLPTLRADKEAGRIRMIGVTTSHGRRHEGLEEIMKSEPLDFVQFTYNIVDREAENRLLPLAAEKGLGVIINRPFQQGALLDRLVGKPLPDWAEEIDSAGWSQYLLKFIISHPAVTCVIPATSRIDHMRENMAALSGPLPDQAMRQRMIDYIEAL